jgi:hypothetical protein
MVGGVRRWSVTPHGLDAFSGCAKQLGVGLEVVLRAAELGVLGRLIEKRGGRTTERRNVARVDSLYRRREIMAKQVPSWA